MWASTAPLIACMCKYQRVWLMVKSIPCIITSNCRQIWHPDHSMSLIVSSIVGSVNEQNIIVTNVCADDWTATKVFFDSVCCEFQ